MPPVSNMRNKGPGGGGTTTTVSHINDFGAATTTTAPARRTASGRAVRVNTTRPSNYYARPFGSFAANTAATNYNNNNDGDSAEDAPGFYPALQFFADAVTALPKEMARQFTVMHEAQAKIHGLDERFQDMVGALLEMPVPPANSSGAIGNGNPNGLVSLGRGMLSFTGNNSLSGSASASVVNGGGAGHSTAASVVGEDENAEDDIARRQRYHEMGLVLKEMLPNMEEKNNGLLEVIRRLNLQLSRIDSVMPYIDEEISEEARYGSMTHWAYSDNRQKKQAPATGASRRDVAATNNLAAAANAIHETEIAQARRDATRETAREKQKGRAKDVLDSDFDDKPKKTHAKVAKSKALGHAGPSGSGISANGEPVKRRKVDKGLAPPAMERSASGAGKGAKGAAKDGPRSTPNAEPTKKAAKSKPLPAPLKRKGINSAQASPALASSPLHSSFTAAMEPPAGRPQVGRLRQNSTTNLRHERVAAESTKRSDSSSGKTNGEKVGEKRKARADEESAGGPDDARKTIETDDNQALQRDDDGKATRPYRSDSNSGKAGRGSKTGTPRNENFSEVPSMKRTRSTRSMRGNREDEDSSEPHQVRGKHRRVASHLVKQLAPFNRSPDLDRNTSPGDGDDDAESMEGGEGEGGERDEDTGQWRRSPRKPKSASRRNTLASEMPGNEDDESSERGDGDEDTAMLPQAESPLSMHDDAGGSQHDLAASPSPGAAGSHTPSSPPPLSPANSPTPPPLSPTPPPPPDDDEDSEEEQDPDSPSATRYCYCDRGSYGEMIGCDNPQCPREWFHLGCTDLREMPGEAEKWFCRDCRPVFAAREGKRGRVGRGGGGRGGR